ncbi:MAG: hypothetical protein K6G28_02945, partial [Acholeplasmatales bacterium]|nr:hypothetical protein [Acholeplasmatales bacterium]
NYFIAFIIGLVFIITSLIHIKEIGYFIPFLIINDYKIMFEISIYYDILYLLILFIFDFIVYMKLDRS